MNDEIHIFEEMVRACELAAEYLGSEYQKSTSVGVKILDNDLKSPIDVNAENMIIEALKKFHLPFFTEEQGWIGSADVDYFLIDGLDGTVNFMCNVPIFCVSVALMRGKKPMAGVVRDVMGNNLCKKRVGQPLTINDKTILYSNRRKRREEAIALSAITPLVATNDDARQRNQEACLEFGKIRMFGSAAWSLMNLASGFSDAVVLTAINIWDVMGGLSLLDERNFVVSVSYPYTSEFLCDLRAERVGLSQ